TPHVEGLDPQAGRTNYLLGNDPSAWHADVTRFGRVAYQQVYPGIDLVYYGTNQQQLEYDFIVAPGAEPGQIGLRFSRMEGLEVNGKGDLVLHTTVGDVVEHAPVLYQEAGGQRTPVAGAYELRGDGTVGLHVGAYDASRALVIDPTLVYSSYLGGNS